MSNISLKIIHGMSEIANQGIGTVTALRKNGIYAKMAVWRKNSFAKEPDIDLKIGKNPILYPIYMLKMFKFALYAWRKYDVLHSHFGHTLLPFALDIKINKLLGIKMFAEFHGSELRWAYNDIEYKYINNYMKDVPKTKRQKKLNKIINGADGIILHDAELLEHLPKTSLPIYIVPLRLNVLDIEPQYPRSGGCPTIVHAPSKRSGKGTNEILDILDKIDLEYKLILVEGKTHREAFEIYKEADIIIDQISVGAYGVFAIEGMALGKPVITYISDEMKATLPRELPIVTAGFDNLKVELENLIKDENLRKQIGYQSREYVEKYHDANKIAKELVKIYEGDIDNNNLFEILGGMNG